MSSPVKYQEQLGIIHQGPEDFMNDAVSVIMRGNMFLPCYINPYVYGKPAVKSMDKERWSKFAMLLRWFDKNYYQILETQALRPADFIKESQTHMAYTLGENVYGYAHWAKDNALVMLRNPSIDFDSYTLTLPDYYKDEFYVTSIYPEARDYGKTSNGKIQIDLAPYETVVLSFDKNSAKEKLPSAEECIGDKITVADVQNNSRIEDGTIKFDYTATIDSKSEQTYLYLQMEGSNDSIQIPENMLILVNGAVYTPIEISSSDGWYSSGIVPSYFWEYAKIRLPKGKNTVSIKFNALQENSGDVSLYVLGQKESQYVYSEANQLPPPEVIYQDGVKLCAVMPDISYRTSLVALSGYDFAYAYDGNEQTFYHSNLSSVSETSPAKVDIIYNKPQKKSSLEYLVRQDGGNNGNILKMELQVSEDGKTYRKIAEAVWDNANPQEYRVLNFDEVTAQYYRIIVTESVNGYLAIAELNLK